MKSFILLSIAMTLLSCNQNTTEIVVDNAYKAEFKNYLSKTAEDRVNYLQLAGLFKLDSLDNTFGKDTINDFVIAVEALPSQIGIISILKKGIVFSATKNVTVKTKEGEAVTNLDLVLDEYGSSIKLYHNQINWQVITRGKFRYLRVWDAKNPAIEAFKSFELFKLTPDFIFEGQFTYYESPKSEIVKSQIDGKRNTTFIGNVTFEYKGEMHDLDVGNSGFTMVSDATTGGSTYGGGRYIYIKLPETNGATTLDFNYLYNPPCAFSGFTTCLYPPRQNNLPFKILAGEKINTE